MFKSTALITFFLLCFAVCAQQQNSLPSDFRQHTLTQYNSSLFNPTFSLERNNPQSFSIWTRWQWQMIDVDPTSIFANYSRSINNKSAFSLGLFQHNTGVFFNSGGVINYAYELKLSSTAKIAIGLNLFGYGQKLANDQSIPDETIIPIPNLLNDFILQAAPGINFSVRNFSLSVGSENLFDYNFGDKVANTTIDDKIFTGMASYDFPVFGSDETAFIRPSVYYRRVPNEDNQIGINALMSTQKLWLQSGYNTFYGVSAGAGGTFFKRLSLGALIELDLGSGVVKNDPSFEIVASYYMGKPKDRRPVKSNSFDDLEQEMLLTEAERAAKIDEEIIKAQRAAETGEDPEVSDKTERDELAEQQKKKEQEEQAAELERLEKARIDEESRRNEAVAEAAKNKEQQQNEAEKVIAAKEEVKLQKGEKYLEVVSEGELESGFYLIANVFGTKKYFNAFMADLRSKGLNPGSFVRKKNNYNHVYLQRYNTMSEARRARDSNYNGKYSGKTWIFRVVGN